MALRWRDLSRETKTALIGGAFVIASAIIGPLVNAAVNHSTGGGSAPPSTVTTSPPSISPTVTASTTTSGSIAPVSLKPRWHGTITIGDPGIDLDGLPPAVEQNPNDFTFWDDAGTLESGNGTFAAWNGGSNPDYAQCHSLVVTNGVSSLGLSAGLELCVLTGDGRTAYVTITSVPADGNDASAVATVWSAGS